MFVIAKMFEELFTSTLNGIAVRIRYASFMPVVLSAILNDLLRRIQTKQHRGTRKNDTVSEDVAIQAQVLSVRVNYIYLS